MKISFINPSPDNNPESPDRWKSISFAATPPLGLLYLATVLINEGIEVSILDQAAKGLSTEQTVKWIKKENPDILGFTTLTGSGQTAATIATEAKMKNPNMTTVFGGYHATVNAERLLQKYSCIDIVVRSEGENTIIALTDCIKKEQNMKRVRGITFRKNGDILSTPDRPLIEKLDSLPFPDRELLDVEYHLKIAEANIAPKKFTSIISSRGCPHRCRFCACHEIARGFWRPRSVKNIIEELHLLVSKGYQQFMFVDDSFTINPKRVIEFCHMVKKEKMDIQWFFEGRVDSCSYDMLREAVEAGSRIVFFGIESANQRILDYYNKKITPEQTKHAVETAKKAGVDVICGSFMVGAPSETKDEIENTLKFAQWLPLDIPQFNILLVFPGTDIWRELTVKGVLDEDKYWETGALVSNLLADTLPFKEIDRLIREYYQSFFLRTKYLLAQTIKLLKSSYRSSVVINNLNRIEPISQKIRSVL